MIGLSEKIIEFLIERMGSSAVDSWRQRTSVDTDISELHSALEKAHLLIERSECWRLPPNKHIDELLPQLKEAVYEAETVVDEFLYQDLKNEVEKPSSGTNFLRNWMKDFPSAVKKAFNELDKISKEMKETCDIGNIPENPNVFSLTARPITSISPITTTVYGREQEFITILKLMGVPISGRRNRSRNENVSNIDAGDSCHNTNHKGNFSVLSIVGMGGVGKTTLAQMVCKDKRVKTYFDLIMWVCVSDNFDLLKLTKEIMENATNKGCELTNLKALRVNLHAKLNSKRFLLVLDDVWSKDWQGLLGPMKGACEGSIVMVTTRNHECVELSGTGIGSSGVVKLEGLEKNIYWGFFKTHAFDSVAISDVDSKLEDISKEICGRLKGSPLAAKTIGSLLRENMDENHWMTIKDSAMWQLSREEGDILPALQLSYQYLPSHLKKCFSYCALYPKGFKFTKWELTKLWIMQGFINLPEQIKVYCKEPPIKEAEDYFHELVRRCFFQKAAGNHSGAYVIHNLMHDVCRFITKDECFCQEKSNWEESTSNHNIRHLSIFKEGVKKEEYEILCKNKKLLFVMLGPERSCHIDVIDKWCQTLTSVRSLFLSKCNIKELPESIGNLKHLQYLDISFTKIEMLPESFCNLYNLVYLNMECCYHIKSVPKGFSRLVNLRFLCWWPNNLILIGHRDLVNFETAVEAENVELFLRPEKKIGNLKHMNKLGGFLIIHDVENILSKKAAEEAQLKNKPLINRLDLCWSSYREMSAVEKRHDEDVIKGLCPHPNLKVLRIHYYGGRTLPSWFQKELLPNLTEIYIQKCKWLTDLEYWLEANQFPMLKIIKIMHRDKLVSLPARSFEGFASLKELTISNCPKLAIWNVMVLPPSIEKLWMESCGGLEKSIPNCFQNLTSLEKLRIGDCPGLVSILAEITNNLKSLSSLCVEGCAELQSLGDIKLLASLKDLTISRCPKLSETRGQDVKGKLQPELLPE